MLKPALTLSLNFATNMLQAAHNCCNNQDKEVLGSNSDQLT